MSFLLRTPVLKQLGGAVLGAVVALLLYSAYGAFARMALPSVEAMLPEPQEAEAVREGIANRAREIFETIRR